jgi:integrase
MRELRARDARSALALEFLILTAARGGEVRGALWSEIDLEKKVWAIGAERMKTKRPHRIPLTRRMLEILAEAKTLNRSDLVFPGPDGKKPLSESAFKELLDRMGYSEITPHGFRSSFRDWAAEETDFPNEVAEMALAHTIKNNTEAAYRRGDLFDKRRQLMEEWQRFCESERPVNSTEQSVKAIG